MLGRARGIGSGIPTLVGGKLGRTRSIGSGIPTLVGLPHGFGVRALTGRGVLGAHATALAPAQPTVVIGWVSTDAAAARALGWVPAGRGAGAGSTGA